MLWLAPWSFRVAAVSKKQKSVYEANVRKGHCGITVQKTFAEWKKNGIG